MCGLKKESIRFVRSRLSFLYEVSPFALSGFKELFCVLTSKLLTIGSYTCSELIGFIGIGSINLEQCHSYINPSYKNYRYIVTTGTLSHLSRVSGNLDFANQAITCYLLIAQGSKKFDPLLTQRALRHQIRLESDAL